jgi:hypothetical protein
MPTQRRRNPGQATRPDVKLQCSSPWGGGGLDLVVCSLGPSLPGAGINPRVLGCCGSGVVELGLLGYPDMTSSPASWRQVEGSAEQVCSWVAVVDRLPWEAMAVVGRYILQLVWVVFKERKIFYLSFTSSFWVP